MDKLRIAIQKNGRLSEKSLKLLKDCGIQLNNGGSLKTAATNFPVEILYLRDDDIPQYVEDQVADVGILGENVVAEKGKDVEIIEHLGFAKCRLALAVRRETDYPGTAWFESRKIATSYPGILYNYMKERGVNTEVESISGSVEIAPGIGLADGICDIVSTGSTLLSNGLKEVETVMESQAVLIANPSLNGDKARILRKLIFRIQAVRNANRSKYILLNAPEDSLEEISALLPGIKSPTVLPLARPGWISLHSVVNEDDFWEVIDKVKEAGAQGILVCPIEKMVI
jgi:ATP phosphoribosyltransferase